VTKGWRILLAFLAALLGFAVGAITVSLIGTVKLMLTPGMEYSSTKDLLVGAPLIFLEGLFWSVLGGALFVLPFGFLLLVWYALTFGPQRLEPGRIRWFVFGFAALLYPPMLYFGPRDAVLLALPMLLGAWTSLTFLNRRLRLAGSFRA
jgi:hypothetical protein